MKDHGESTQKKIRQALQSAIESTAGSGSRKLTVSQILKVAGVSRSTFYTYYENYEDVLEDLAMDTSEQIIEGLRRGNLKNPGLSGYINGYLEVLQFIYAHKKLFEVLLEHRFFDQVFVDSVIEYLYESYLVEYPNEDPDVLRYSAIGSTNFVYGMVKEWERNGYDRTPEELAKLLQGALKLSLKIFQPK